MNNLKPGAPSISRLEYLDVAKFFLILSVVVYHSYIPNKEYIGWFQLPGFFFISGVLHKQPGNNRLKSFLKNKTIGLLQPYFTFGLSLILLIVLYNWITGGNNIFQSFILLLARLVYSGRLVFGTFVAFWFIPTLLLAITAFSFVLRYLGSNKTVVLLMLFLSYAIGMALTHFKNIFFPWNIEVVPIAMYYYGIGYLSKELVASLKESPKFWWFLLPIVCVCGLLVFLNVTGYFSFSIGMKASKYSNIFFPLFIPLLFTAAIVLISMLIKNNVISKVLSYVGLNSLIIMYLHVPVNNLIEAFFIPKYPGILFIVFGISIPLLIGALLNKNPITRGIYFGRKKKTESLNELTPAVVLNS